jgi:hypothetical protein
MVDSDLFSRFFYEFCFFFTISSFDVKLLALELCDFFTFFLLGHLECELVKLN